MIALLILIVFLFGGQSILSFLHLQQESFTIAGGIILLIIGLRLIFPNKDGVMGEQPGGEPFIVPKAIPMIAGHFVLAMLMLLTHTGIGGMSNPLFALLLAWVLPAVLLLTAPLPMRPCHLAKFK